MARLRARRAAGDPGFTLIELLIVIVILGILAGIAIFAVSAFRGQASGGAYDADRRNLDGAIAGYYARNNAYPPDLQQLVTGGYLDNASISPDKLHLIGEGYTIEFTPGNPPTLSDKAASLAAGGTPVPPGGGGGGGSSPSPSPSPSAATPPAAPSAPTLAAGSDSGLPNDRITNDDTPTLTGTAVPGATVTILANGVSVGSGSAAGGSYSITTSSMPDGVKAMTATASLAGADSSPSGPLSITIDTQVTAPAITAPLPGATGVNRGPIITGDAGEAGGTITVKVTSAGDTTGKTATATPGSSSPFSWSLDMANNTLTDRQEQTATATHTDVAGNVSPPSTARKFNT